MNNILGLILSFIFVFAIIGLATVLQKKNIIKEEVSRKLVHIGVSNWWFLVLYAFDNVYYAIIAPIIFIILNYISYKKQVFKAMERSNSSDLGTIYFPISLLITTVLAFTILDKTAGALAILILGYGDGLAAIMGKKYGKTTFNNGKSTIGTVTMFIVSCLVSFLLLAIYQDYQFIQIITITMIIGFAATIVEFFTPKGIDNLTIPLVVLAIYQVAINVLL